MSKIAHLRARIKRERKLIPEWTAERCRAEAADCDRLPRCGIIIEATPDELAALPFNPVYAEVEVRPAKEARDER